MSRCSSAGVPASSRLRRTHPRLSGLILALAVVGSQGPAQEMSEDGKTKGEARASLSVSDEASTFTSLALPLPSYSNLVLVQPAFSYRQEQRWRVAASLAGLNYTCGQGHSTVRVKEAYFSASLGDWDVTAGKKILQWGTGYAFTPTGVLDPPRNPANPTDRLNLNEGREMAEVNWVRSNRAVTVAWASAGLAAKHRPYMRETAAFRYNTQVAGFDASLVYAHYRGGAEFVGANFTRVLGSSIELHGEFARRSGSDYVSIPGGSEPILLVNNRRTAVLLGGKYTHSSGVNTIVEVFHSTGLAPATPLVLRPGTLLLSTEQRTYFFARIGKSRLRERPGWKEWDIGGMVLSNLTDGSFMPILDVERRLGNRFATYARASWPRGKRWVSEYGMIPFRAQYTIGLRFHI